jgi:hypothetical protein
MVESTMPGRLLRHDVVVGYSATGGFYRANGLSVAELLESAKTHINKFLLRISKNIFNPNIQ